MKNNKLGVISKDDEMAQLSEFNDNLNGIRDVLKKN